MKSIINSPEEVVTPKEPSAVKHICCQTMDAKMIFHANICLDNGNETDQTTSSTVTDSASEEDQSESVGSISDCDDSVINEKGSVTQNDTASDNSRERRSVSFGPIHVRQYERIVGDHPDTKIGVPLSIGWSYYEDESVSIERYEADRIRKVKIRMSSITRKNMLLNVFGLPEKEILQAEQRSKKLRKQREREAARSESTLKNFGRKLRKGSVSLLKGMSYAQIGSLGGGAGFSSTVEQMF